MQHDRTLWDKLMEKNGIIGKDNCPFCIVNEEDKKLTIFKTDFWEVLFNKYPYGGIKKHLLIVPKRHIELTKELSDSELIDLKNIHKFLYEYYKGDKYFSFIRESFKGRSIKHLHYHYLPGNIHGSDFEEILNKQGY